MNQLKISIKVKIKPFHIINFMIKFIKSKTLTNKQGAFVDSVLGTSV